MLDHAGALLSLAQEDGDADAPPEDQAQPRYPLPTDIA
jgi:hypothetical protein